MPSRILLVDDEEEVLSAWETTLRPLRHEVVKAHNEAEAVAAASEHPFDLVLIDYLIPGKNGVEIIAGIRKKLPLIRSVLISGRLDEKLNKAELQDLVHNRVEVDEVLHKPVKPKLLRETVSRLLASRPADWKTAASKSIDAYSVTETEAAEADKAVNTRLRKSS
jgi:CheY-like chemotaxis protein